ncbi:MAG: hypothetical protein GEV11_14355 [Streptosporangiales bacterium]|nr:hypothetical protein [Streptosporangiales bacterium]
MSAPHGGHGDAAPLNGRRGARAHGAPLVVVGDVLLDVDVEGVTRRRCPDSPAPVVEVYDERSRPGGAGLAARLAARHGGVTAVVGLGDDGDGARLGTMLQEYARVVRLPLRGRTPRKTRVLAQGRTVARLDHGDGRAVPGPIDTSAERALRGAGAVLVSDYGRGVAAHPAIRRLVAAAAERGVPVVWDPHRAGPHPVPGVTLATPNETEAAAFAGLSGQPGADAAEDAADAAEGVPRPPGGSRRGGAGGPQDVAELLRDAWGCAGVAVTCGARGAVLARAGESPRFARAPEAPAEADTCGAGDAFAAEAALALRAGASVTEAVTKAVARASAFVAGGGVRALPRARYEVASAGGESR